MLTLLKKNKLLLLICLGLSAGCKGPDVIVCLSDPANDGMQCSDKDGNGFFVPYVQSENFVCLNPDDARELFEFCKRK